MQFWNNLLIGNSSFFLYTNNNYPVAITTEPTCTISNACNGNLMSQSRDKCLLNFSKWRHSAKNKQNATNHISNSCIMYPSGLPDMYTRTQGPQALGCCVHIRQITRAHDTTDMNHDCRLIACSGQIITRANTRVITGSII